MKRSWISAALAVLVTAPAAVAAQDAPRARRDRDDTPFRTFSFSGQRGRIGVVINTAADAEKDKIGARIEAVTPGGPAAKAGLKADDIITRFGGTALGGVSAGDEGQSGPGMKLLELARALDPGDTVQVEYRRGSENRRGTIVAEDLGGPFAMRVPERGGFREFTIDPDIRMRMGDPEGFVFSFGGAPWGGLNLVTLDADLGSYFGTQEGVLVVKAPADSALPLKSGDVILAIDGRKPTSPEHAMRILRSYEGGEAVKLDIMRQKRRTTATWTVPENTGRLRMRAPERERVRVRDDRQEF
jgi:C-terminal processing protease CtpA/Prc